MGNDRLPGSHNLCYQKADNSELEKSDQELFKKNKNKILCYFWFLASIEEAPFKIGITKVATTFHSV